MLANISSDKVASLPSAVASNTPLLELRTWLSLIQQSSSIRQTMQQSAVLFSGVVIQGRQLDAKTTPQQKTGCGKDSAS